MFTRIATWNLNGIRSVLNKGLLEFCTICNADAYCFQEIKALPEQAEVNLPGYSQHWNSAERKGYSGTLILLKETTGDSRLLNTFLGINHPEHASEGRAVTLELDSFYLVNEYTPNSRNSEEGLARLDYRMAWEDARRAYLKELDQHKPVILCGDLNVAHQEIDLKNPKSNRGRAGFSDEEREKFGELLHDGFTDAFRCLYPDREGAYTWWSYRSGARSKNIGWRIDYFIVSNRLADKIKEVAILPEITGSDHCPVLLDIDL